MSTDTQWLPRSVSFDFGPSFDALVAYHADGTLDDWNGWAQAVLAPSVRDAMVQHIRGTALDMEGHNLANELAAMAPNAAGEIDVSGLGLTLYVCDPNC